MMDAESGKAIALVDLDTVKPGLVHYDIGDCLRSGCNPLGEETADLKTLSLIYSLRINLKAISALLVLPHNLISSICSMLCD